MIDPAFFRTIEVSASSANLVDSKNNACVGYLYGIFERSSDSDYAECGGITNAVSKSE